MYTVSSRLGYRSTRHSPSSRLSFCAARSKRARCDSHGLLSLSTCGGVAIVVIVISGMIAIQGVRRPRDDFPVRSGKRSEYMSREAGKQDAGRKLESRNETATTHRQTTLLGGAAEGLLSRKRQRTSRTAEFR